MGRRQLTRPVALAIVAALVLGAAVVAVRTWVVEPVVVASDSMEPTVAEGSTVLVARWSAASVDPGQLAVIRSPDDGRSVLKRVVAVAGQTVVIRDGVVHVDEVALAEPYVDPRGVDGTFFRQVEVPAGHVYVLGDNRATSVDSRDFGPVPLDDVIGTVLWAPCRGVSRGRR